MRTCACSYCRRTSVPLRGNLVFFGFCSCERQLHDARDQRIMRSSRQKTHMNRGGVCPELAMRLRRIASPMWPLRGQSQRTRAKTGCISGTTNADEPPGGAYAREILPTHGGAEKDGAGVSGLGPPARQGTTHARTFRPHHRVAVVVEPWDGRDPPLSLIGSRC